MTTLVVWKEIGISSVKEAEARYHQILSDESPVPLSRLDDPIQEFVRAVRGSVPEAEPVGIGEAPVGYSRLGVVLNAKDDLPENPIPKVDDIAHELGLTVYVRELELVMGQEEYPDISVEEAD